MLQYSLSCIIVCLNNEIMYTVTREYSEHKHLDAVEKLLELRKEFIDKQSDLYETEAENRRLVDQLRSEVNTLRSGAELREAIETRLQGLERSLEATKASSGGRVADLEKKLHDLQRTVEAAANNGGRMADLEKKLLGRAEGGGGGVGEMRQKNVICVIWTV